MNNRTYSIWFYAAAMYNLLWGTLNIFFPKAIFVFLAIKPPETPYWQVVGMFVLIYAPAYFWAARYPNRHCHLIFIGALGKTLGSIGFLWAYITGTLPLAFGIVNIFNDLIWLPIFFIYLNEKSRSIGIKQFLLGKNEPRGQKR
ncbi:MAG: alkyl hydroperoxide reductase [Methanobacteriota archaeon]|nr:MAG: alkyl hydroperoxide reductase [Euryarchaeota archaeon]